MHALNFDKYCQIALWKVISIYSPAHSVEEGTSLLCHFSLNSGFNTVYFRALMKSTSVTNGSISTQLITFQEPIQQPHWYSRNFLISDLLHHTAKAANIYAYLGISGVFKNIRNFAASLDFRLSFLFAMKEVIIYRQKNSEVKKYNSPIVGFLDAFLWSEPYLRVTHHGSDSSLVI